MDLALNAFRARSIILDQEYRQQVQWVGGSAYNEVDHRFSNEDPGEGSSRGATNGSSQQRNQEIAWAPEITSVENRNVDHNGLRCDSYHVGQKSWQRVPLEGRWTGCENCSMRLNRFIRRCRGCEMMVCHKCERAFRAGYDPAGEERGVEGGGGWGDPYSWDLVRVRGGGGR